MSGRRRSRREMLQPGALGIAGVTAPTINLGHFPLFAPTPRA